MPNNYVGAGFIGGPWPDERYTSGTTGYAMYFTGYISDAAFWDPAVDAAEVQAMYAAGTHPAALLTKVTRPTGSVYAQVSYDPLTGRVTSVTDDNGGTWQVAAAGGAAAPARCGSHRCWARTRRTTGG